MKRKIEALCWFALVITVLCSCKISNVPTSQANDGYKLVWADEFDKPERPDSLNWIYEKGFVRNEELQWYQEENVWCEKGCVLNSDSFWAGLLHVKH